jgi:hypothetical protein
LGASGYVVLQEYWTGVLLVDSPAAVAAVIYILLCMYVALLTEDL